VCMCVCVCLAGWWLGAIAAGCMLLLRTAHGREAAASVVLLRRRAAELLSVLHTCVRPLLPCLLRDGIR
jgi:hypothetical protein